MMGTVSLTREFRLPDDGWFQSAPLGAFAHAGPVLSRWWMRRRFDGGRWQTRTADPLHVKQVL